MARNLWPSHDAAAVTCFGCVCGCWLAVAVAVVVAVAVAVGPQTVGDYARAPSLFLGCFGNDLSYFVNSQPNQKTRFP